MSILELTRDLFLVFNHQVKISLQKHEVMYLMKLTFTHLSDESR